MTEGPDSVPGAPGHPDPGEIAAHAERRLSGAEAARMDEHLAGCSECYETFAETARFLLGEELEEAVPRSEQRILPFVRRPVFRLAAGLAVAAGLLVAFQQLWRARHERAASPVAELAQAMGTTRFVEPRLTGGFQHGRLVTLRSGERRQGLDAYPPAVLAAVAQIRERAEGDTSPEALGALAVTYLVSGDVDKAVKALESATAQDPKNPRLESDLAAAYLVRASRLDEPADLPKALEAAEKAIEQDDAPAEAWFNRALTLEQLHLLDSARKAWNDFLQRDPASGWADEARKHLEELPAAQQSTIEEDRARARAALAEGAAAIDRLADEAPAVLSGYFLAELLPAWADAQLTGHPSAVVLRAQARQVGEALFRATGDALPHDAALALSAPPSGPSRDPPYLQALGYKALREAQSLYDLQQPSCDTFREAHRLLESGASPYSAWARERIVVACLYLAGSRQTLPELGRIETLAAARGYRRLLGYVRWMQALVHLDGGSLSASLDGYRRARDDFRALRDPEEEASVHARLAQTLAVVGESRAAWRERVAALALLGEVRKPTRRHALLSGVMFACLSDRLPRAALHVETLVVELAARAQSAARLSEALIWRSRSYLALGSDDGAAADLARAREWIPRVGDREIAENLAVDADAVEGRMLATRAPERATVCLERVLGNLERAGSVLLPGLRVDLARAAAARGQDDAVEAELSAGIRLLESQRAALRDPGHQAAFFDRATELFDAMVSFQVDRRHDPQRALAFVERGRARQLLDSIAPRTVSNPDAALTGAAASPREPEALQRALPAGAALVYYACLADRLLAWVLTPEALHFVDQPLALDELRRLVAAHETAIEGRAELTVVRRHAASLFDRLIRPLGPLLRGQRVLILIPDGVLQPVAFASLWDAQSERYLVEDHLVGVAPSGSVFVRASAASAAPARNGRRSLLAIGNPRFDRSIWSELPSLPGAEAEAETIARLYQNATLLTGRAATKSAFLQSARASRIVHYAGHALADDAQSPARLLFAPDASGADSGALALDELHGGAFPHTRVVVLAACRTATGGSFRLEGGLSLARPFLAAGVPSVVASLWDVDDAVSESFFAAFHGALVANFDSLRALQRTQIAFLRAGDPLRAHPSAWAGFVAIGGVDPRTLTGTSLDGPGQRL